jgi:hypothetical protein
MISERELIKIQNLLNVRPRKTLGFNNTPKELFIKEVLKKRVQKYGPISRRVYSRVAIIFFRKANILHPYF